MLARPAFHHKRSPTLKSFQDFISGIGGAAGAGRVVYTDILGNLKTELGFEYNDAANILSVPGDIRAGPGSFVGGIAQYYTNASIGTVLTGFAGSISDFFIAARDGGACFRIMANTRNIQLGNDKIAINGTFGHLTWLADNVADIGALGTTRPRTGYFGTSININGAILTSDASNILAQRNGTNSQSFYIYNTFTDLSNYERLNIHWLSNIATIEVAAAGTGTQRVLSFATSGQHRWQIKTDGHFIAATDNAYDIGASGATRPRTGYFAISVITPTATLSTINNTANIHINPTVGDIRLNPSAPGNIVFETGGTQRWVIQTDGHFRAPAAQDNTYDIGLSTLRPRTIYVGTGIDSGSGSLVLKGAGSTAQTITGANSVLAGNLNVNGNTTLGDSTTDTAATTGAHTSGMGTGSGVMTLHGKANVNTTGVGNVGAGEDNLITYSLPANSLNAAGKGVRITAWGTGANNANAKTLKLYFGTQIIYQKSLAVSVAHKWTVTALVFSTGTDTQDWMSNFANLSGTVFVGDVNTGTATQDDGAAITIKCTGEATSDNDIVQEGMLVEFFN